MFTWSKEDAKDCGTKRMPLALPNATQWSAFKDAFETEVKDATDFAKRLSAYQNFSADRTLTGIEGMFRRYPETKKTFFQKTLPHVVKCALDLPTLLRADGTIRWTFASEKQDEIKISKGRFVGDRFIPILDCPGSVYVQRSLVLSLMANVFLGTLPRTSVRYHDMPSNNIPFNLFIVSDRCPQEIAKLRMIVNYFDRTADVAPLGFLEIHRIAADTTTWTDAKWANDATPLGPLGLTDLKIGMEDSYGAQCMQVDFANRCLGGGVITGGCVQEEIRFAICPELIVGMLFSPVMLDNEAIHIIGGEQFSKYDGYAFSLKYGGDFRDPSPRREDGTVLSAITAIDALDGRHEVSSAFRSQWRDQMIVRELNKALAGFLPEDSDRTLRSFRDVATGNWGCGAFLGNVSLKAVLQWMAASVAGRRLWYFPFDQSKFATSFEHFIRTICPGATTSRDDKRKLVSICTVWTGQDEKSIPTVTVGELFRATVAVSKHVLKTAIAGKARVQPDAFFSMLLQMLQKIQAHDVQTAPSTPPRVE